MTAPALPTDRRPDETAAARGRPAPPLRERPDLPDELDAERIRFVRDQCWAAQDVAYLARDRQVEENIRMLLGRQWEVFSPHTGGFVDLTQFMSDQERAWRQRPVVNKLFYWFILTHSRLTESDPIIGFRPATADRKDAMLAEVQDPLFKTLWQECGMAEVLDRLVAWLIPGGRAYLKSRPDFEAGALVPFAMPDTGEVVELREGQIAVDVCSPLECRGSWDNQPWHQKRWHMHRTFLTPDDIETQFGVRVEGDRMPGGVLATQAILTRLLFGSGFWGAGSGRLEADTTSRLLDAGDAALVCVDERWERPSARFPRGRLTIVTERAVLYDGPRPFQFKYTSPIRAFDYVNVPGRQTGSSPQEFMNPLQRTWNKGWQQLFEHRALTTNPLVELDTASGLTRDDFVSRPGNVIPVAKRPGVDAFRYVAPPSISGDVWKIQSVVSDLLDIMGNVHGGSGAAPTSDASGDLVEQLRFNSDRYTVPTAKRMVREIARLAEDWMAMLPVMWPFEKVVSYAGEDNIARVVQVAPELWSGKVNVVPDAESMLPESVGERRQRVQQLYTLGAFGPPGAPDAVSRFLEYSRFPHLSRTVRPGGIDRVTAEHHLGALLMGTPAAEIPGPHPWINAGVHVAVFRDFMASPDFDKLDPALQMNVLQRFAALSELATAQAAQQLAQQAAAQAALSPDTSEASSDASASASSAES